jgi:GT2 family glycosyltransferase/tetratricopeptide (TPR) repeat protein
VARPPVSIIISTTNDWELTRGCLNSLPTTLGIRDQVIVLDNGPTDRDGPALSRYPWVEVIRVDHGQWVMGAAGARHGILVFLDSATVCTGHWLDPLVRALENDPTVGAAGPCTNGPPGPQTADGAEYVGRGPMRAFARTWCANHRGETSPAEHLSGFCLAVRRSIFDGLLGSAHQDSRSGSGDDISDRLSQAGCRLLICHDSFVHRTGPRSGPPLVSACLITKNEQADIAECLASLQGGFVDEVVIYDTGSTDDTITIARALGATVIEGYWDDDFSRARNAALAHCRGEWIAWLDADETLVCDDIDALRQLLMRTKPEIDAWSVPIHNLTGVGVSTDFVHHAARLFRRDGQEWTSRLHEQIVRPGRPGGLRQAMLETAFIRHTGYLDQTWKSKDKTERNLRIATAGVADADGENKGLSLLNLARSNFTAGHMEQAIGYSGEVLEWSDDPIIRRMALRTAAECLIQRGRTDEALEWTARLRAECTKPVQADMTEAKIRLVRFEYAAALECLDRVGAGSRDEDGFGNSAEQLAGPRAEALAGLGRPGEAADVLLDCLSQSETLDLHLGKVLEHLEAAGRPAADLAAVIPANKASYFLAQVLQLQPGPADTLLDACFAQMSDQTAVLAAGASLARNLGVDRALVWSSRLRAAGHAEVCPLVAQAAANGPKVDRARAAAVAYRMFGDDRAYRAYETIAATVTPSERAQIRAETVSLCPELAPLLDRTTGRAPGGQITTVIPQFGPRAVTTDVSGSDKRTPR